MSVSRVLNRWLNRVYKSLAILLVLFAVSISAFRLFLPYAHHYKTVFEDYINSTFNANVQIESISMRWQEFGPTLIATNINLLRTQTSAIDIEKMDIRVNFWDSITSRKLISHYLTLDGVKVSFDQTADSRGKLPANEEALLDNISNLFLKQLGQFSVNDSEVIVKKHDGDRIFKINHLNWLNKGNTHKASGDVRVDGVSSNHLKLMVNLKGGKRENLAGKVYLQASELNITPWLDRVLAIGNDKTNSNLNFDAWLAINKGRPTSLQVELRDNYISWLQDDIAHKIAVNNGQLSFIKKAQGNEFYLRTSPLTILQNDQAWQPTIVQIEKDQDALAGYISSADLMGLNDIFSLLNADEKTQGILDGLSAKGHVQDLHFNTDDKGTSATAFVALDKTNFVAGIPGLDNLSAKIRLENNVLAVDIDAHDGHLDFDKHFIQPIPYSKIKTQIVADFSQSDFKLDVNDIVIESPELSLVGDVNITIPESGDASMSLLTTINNLDAKHANHYYPHLLMGKNLVDYLNEGIIDGFIPQANVLFNGPLSKFPFNENEGIFVVDAELTKSTYSFAKEWPAIEKFDANLNFTNNSMLITARAGELVGLNVVGVEAAIDELKGDKILTVDVNVRDEKPIKVTNLMNESPFVNTVGKTLEHIVINKPIDVDFHLHLPLDDKPSVIASGLVNFAENHIALSSPLMEFSKVSGLLNFENGTISAKNVDIYWRDMPISISTNSSKSDEYYTTTIDMSANWTEGDWQKNIPDDLVSYGEGNLNWQGALSLFEHDSGGFSYDLTLSSDLKESTVMFPAPYNKTAEEEVAFEINVDGHNTASTFNATMGDELSFYGVLNHQAIQFSQAHLVLGDEKMLLPMDGFHITTSLAKADINQWHPFISDILGSISQQRVIKQQTPVANSQLFTVPERIRGTIGKLDMLGHSLSDVSFNLLDKDAWWLLQLNAKEARTEVTFYPDWQKQGVAINADFLHFRIPEDSEDTQLTQQSNISNDNVAEETMELADGDSAAIIETFDSEKIFNNVPPVKFHCDSCKVGMADFGEVDFSIIRDTEDTLVLKQFRAQRDKSELTFDMTWRHNESDSVTSLIGTSSISKIERESEKLGFESIIKDSGLEMSFDTQWLGGPQDLALSSLNGAVSATISEGYLAEVSDKAKIFSVLSLQSLVRKLTLDFRDIFSDGMFYSSITGDFRLKDGVLYTENTQMDGAAGNMLMAGNTVLDSGELDYKLSYKPNLTSSLPVLGWIATLQPTIFLAGIAIDQVITSSVVSEFSFELTGNIDDPNMKEVNRKTKDISVGRSQPPQIVDTKKEEPAPAQDSKVKDRKNKPMLSGDIDG